ncbi:hypothetical protein CTAYLR_010139 [Chrysophaeum taylorii]|uniref:Glutaredoxin domain-containing protein n=1 Tax=Chrysophaeum taylorii TaxID=2483200 RepID=A0AAD7XKE5_9STRA|nr:hypothetical protein CTAYLR_010139 [Chrysophaeum taylorii]
MLMLLVWFGVGSAFAAPRMSLSPPTKDRIDSMIGSNKVMLFMKGSKVMPQCGFSNMAVQILNAVGADYETCDVLADDAIRSGIKEYSEWPTIPQLYVDGERGNSSR